MTKKPLVQTLDALRRDLLAARAENTPPTPWRVLAARWPGVPAGTLCAISKGREPKSAAARRALGLPVMVPAPACACGEVHLRKGRCPNAPRPAELARYTAAIAWLAGRAASTPTAGPVYGRRGQAVGR